MRELAVMVVAVAVGAVMYAQYSKDERYYDAVAPSREDMNPLERATLVLQREIDIEQREETSVLQKFESGEMSLTEYEEYLERKSAREQREIEEAYESIGSMFDPEKGMFSGGVKMAQHPEFRKREQIKKLDAELKDVISAMSQDNPSITKARLSVIKWIPVGNSKIDEEMNRYYTERVEALMSHI